LATNRVCPTGASLAGTGSVDEVVDGGAVDGGVADGVFDGTGGDGLMVAEPPGTVVGVGCARAVVGLPANDSRPSATTKATRAAGIRNRLRITA
jgi:hypothetical protein